MRQTLPKTLLVLALGIFQIHALAKEPLEFRALECKKVCEYYGLDFSSYNRIFANRSPIIPAFEVVTPIKSGSNLLFKAISLMAGIPHSGLLGNDYNPSSHGKYYYYENHYYDEIEFSKFLFSDVKQLTLIRDPRDMLISMCFWFDWVKEPLWVQSNIEERIKLFLENKLVFFNARLFRLQLERLQQLMDAKENVHLVYFEKLVGEKGGGSKENQFLELQKLAKFLNIELNDNQMEFVYANLFGNSYSFRKGQIGGWRKYFDDRAKELFKKQLGHFLIDFGYEIDNQW